MTRLHHNRNWKIEVFGREHGVPHFHLQWPEGRASLDIETLEIIIGNPPPLILVEARKVGERKQTADTGRVAQTQLEIIV
jgi:hypothetical protein